MTIAQSRSSMLLGSQGKYFEDPPEKTFKGVRIGYDINSKKRGTCIVTVDDEPIKSVLNLDAGMPTFEWGYKGLSAKNLAKSMLLSLFKESEITDQRLANFVREFVELFTFDGWEVKESVLSAWLDTQEIRERQQAKKETIRKEENKNIWMVALEDLKGIFS